MSQISCPRCDETVRVPAALLDEAIDDQQRSSWTAQCPWCSDQISGDEIVSRLPPLLRLDLPATVQAADSISAVDHFGSITPAELDSQSPGDQLDFMVSDPKPSVDNFEVGNFEVGNFEVGELSTSVSKTSPVASMQTRPSGRKQASPIGTAIKIILGGIAAVPIAGIILTLAGRPLPIDLGFFPFEGANGGRSKPKFAAAPPMDRPPSNQPPQKASVSSSASDRPTRPTVLEPAIQSDLDSPNSISDEFSSSERTSGSGESGDLMGSFGDVLPTDKEAIQAGPSMGSRQNSSRDSVTTNLTASSPSDTPTVLPADLQSAVDNASAAVQRAAEMFQRQVRNTAVLQEGYRRICDVAANLDAETSGHPSVTRLLTSVLDSPKLADTYADVGPRWPKVGSRDTNGILLIGTLRRSPQETVMLFGDGQSLVVQAAGSVLGGSVLDETVAARRVVALGRIQEESSPTVIRLLVAQPADQDQ